MGRDPDRGRCVRRFSRQHLEVHPTAILGVALGYLLVETDNLFYSMLFHFVNNAVPVLLLGLLSFLPEQGGAGEMEAVQTAMSSHLRFSLWQCI